eukprot:m.143157 g.143157  ORF g.143157 m.143157 type:complete len:228 (+) comp14083_c2_seq1:176-859(+)
MVWNQKRGTLLCLTLTLSMLLATQLAVVPGAQTRSIPTETAVYGADPNTTTATTGTTTLTQTATTTIQTTTTATATATTTNSHSTSQTATTTAATTSITTSITSPNTTTTTIPTTPFAPTTSQRTTSSVNTTSTTTFTSTSANTTTTPLPERQPLSGGLVFLVIAVTIILTGLVVVGLWTRRHGRAGIYATPKMGLIRRTWYNLVSGRERRSGYQRSNPYGTDYAAL